MTVTATAARATRAVRPARREATPLHRTHPTPTHPTPTRAVPPKPRKPVNEPGDTESHDHLTRRQAGAGTDASRTAAIVVTAASEVLAGLRPVDHLARWTSPSLFDALARRAGLQDPGAPAVVEAPAHSQRAHRADDVGGLRGDRSPGGGQPGPGRGSTPGAAARALDPHRPGDRVIPPDPGGLPGPTGSTAVTSALAGL